MVCFLFFFHRSKRYAACIIIARFLFPGLSMCVRAALKEKKQKQEQVHTLSPLHLSNTRVVIYIYIFSVRSVSPDHGRDVLYDRKSSPPSPHCHGHSFIYAKSSVCSRMQRLLLRAMQSNQVNRVVVTFLFSWYDMVMSKRFRKIFIAFFVKKKKKIPINKTTTT